jgi:excisionase family DNA binding protein
MDDQYVTVAEAMAYLRCKKTLLFRLLAEGKLERRKVGSRTLVTIASLEALVESCAA